MITRYYVEPTDSLFIRGNLAFGGAGEHGASVMPPPPSLFAGAFRSAILAQDAGRLARFQCQGDTGERVVDECIGTLDPKHGGIRSVGTFAIADVSLAGVRGDGHMDALRPPPADLLYFSADATASMRGAQSRGHYAALSPKPSSALVCDSGLLPSRPCLATPLNSKPSSGFLLNEAGWLRYIAGTLPDAEQSSVPSEQIYRSDPRLGIGLDYSSGSAQQGLIYTTTGLAFSPPGDTPPEPENSGFSSSGFVVGIEGSAGLLGDVGQLRLGGDGRSARYRRLGRGAPVTASEGIRASGRFRLIMLTAGLFTGGWLPNGVARDGEFFQVRAEQFSARLVCAAVPAYEVVSGWDLFRWAPKPAERSVPAGSVYWFDEFEGDISTLATWARSGLTIGALGPARRAEGFNRACVAPWLSAGLEA